MSEKILVFIPAYNCQKQIPRVLKNFNQELKPFITEIMVVDNQSQDQTIQAAIDEAKTMKNFRVKVFRNNDNYSLGGSHKVAFNYALENNFDYVVVLHGDDQGSIQDLLPQLKAGKHRQYDSYLGSRFHSKSQLVGYSAFRTFGNHVMNWLVSLVARHWISDMGSGLNIYKTSYLKDKFYLYFPNNLTFNVYMVMYGVYAKSKFKFFPLTWREDDQVSNARIFKQAFIILGLLFDYMFKQKKLFSKAPNEYSTIDYNSTCQFDSQSNEDNHKNASTSSNEAITE